MGNSESFAKNRRIKVCSLVILGVVCAFQIILYLHDRRSYPDGAIKPNAVAGVYFGYRQDTSGNPLNNDDVMYPAHNQADIEVIDIKKSTRKKCSNDKFFIYLCDGYRSCSGWGDRMKAIASVYVMARVMRRNFQIVHENPALCPLSDFYDYSEYNWYECTPYFDKSQRSKAKNLINFGRSFMESVSTVNLSSLLKGRVSYIRTNRYWLKQLTKRKDVQAVFPDHCAQKNSDMLLYRDVLKHLFKPKERLQADLSSFLQRHRNGTKLICAHIRNLRSNAMRSLQFLKRYSGDKNYTIFIASDLPKTRTQAKHVLGNDSIVLEGTIRHVDYMNRKNKTAVEGIAYTDDQEEQCEGLYTAILEQTILSNCDILHITQSGFGLAAAAVRKNPNSNLYCYNRADGAAFLPCTLEYALHHFIQIQ